MHNYAHVISIKYKSNYTRLKNAILLKLLQEPESRFLTDLSDPPPRPPPAEVLEIVYPYAEITTDLRL